jgi:hypothetical protein
VKTEESKPGPKDVPPSGPIGVYNAPGAKFSATCSVINGPNGKAIENHGEMNLDRSSVNAPQSCSPSQIKASEIDGLISETSEPSFRGNASRENAWTRFSIAVLGGEFDEHVAKDFAAQPDLEKRLEFLKKLKDSLQPISEAEPLDNPIPKHFYEDQGIRQNMAQQLSELSREILNFAKDREKGEQALPALDPSVPEGKTNIPWVKLNGYHIKTQTAFKFGTGHYEMRCRELMSALSNRADLADDVNLVKTWCRGLPKDSTALKSLSVYLAKLAEKVQEPPN